MKKIFFIYIFILSTVAASAQTTTQNSPLVYSKNKIYQNHKKLSYGQLLILTDTHIAHESFLKARNADIIANTFGIIGGVLVGYELGSLIGGKKINPLVMGIGAVGIGVGIPFDNKRKKYQKLGLKQYNKSLTYNRYNLRLGTTSNGIGLCLNF